MSLQSSLNISNIMSAFQKVNLFQGQYYLNDQICMALDKLYGQTYDRGVAQQLFEQCQINQQGQVLLQDFAQVILDADKILKSKIVQTEQQIKNTQDEAKEIQNQIAQDKYTHQQNQYGIDRDSQFNLIIKNAQGIPPQDFINSYISVSVDNAEQNTPISQGDKYNPQYNAQLSFSIIRGLEEILLTLYIQDKNQRKTIIGQNHIDLQTIKDQQIHQLQLQLLNQKGSLSPTIVYVDTQWIYNKITYLQAQQKQCEQQIINFQSDIEDYKKDLFIVQAPFLDTNIRNSLVSSLKPQNQQFNSAQLYQQQQYQNIQQPQNNNQAILNINKDKINENQITNEELDDELLATFVIIGALLILSVFQSFCKPDFVNLLLIFLYMLIFLRDCFNTSYIQILGAISIAAIFNDVIWITIYKHWGSATDQTVPTWGDKGAGVLKMVIVFHCFAILLKGGLCYLLFRFYKATQENKKLVLNIWQFEFSMGNLNQNIFKQQNNQLLL